MRKLPRGKSSLPIVFLAAALAGILLYALSERAKPPVRIGVLHSLTGTMAASEAPLVDALRLAAEEANQSGGINGAQIE